MKILTAVMRDGMLYVGEDGESDPSPQRLETKLHDMADVVVDLRRGIVTKNREGPSAPIDGRTPAEMIAARDAAIHTTLAERDAARAETKRLRAVLEDVWAAIGDRLLAEGPLSKEYAHSVSAKVTAALGR